MKNPSTVHHYSRGISSLLLPKGIIAYAHFNCKIPLFFTKLKVYYGLEK